MDLIDIGAQVRAARKARRLTQRDVVERSGVSRARLDSLENGRASDIGFRNVIRIMNVVGLDFQIVPAAARRPTLYELTRENAEEDEAEARRRRLLPR